MFEFLKRALSRWVEKVGGELPDAMAQRAGELEAEGKYEAALRIDPQSAAEWSNLGQTRRAMKDRAGSETAFRRALKADPRCVNAQMGLGVLALEVKDGRKAVNLFEEAAQWEPGNAAAWSNLGFARKMVGDLAGAKEAFRRALRLDLDFQPARNALKKIDEAEREVQVQVHRRPGPHLAAAEPQAARSDARGIRDCHTCSAKFTELGHATLQNPAVGGALCWACGRFYCEPCVAKVLFRESKAEGMMCACGKARAALDAGGGLALENFEELVVYRWNP